MTIDESPVPVNPVSEAKTASQHGSGRRHDLDALRAFAMLLGIALHAALSFAPFPWVVQDTRKHEAFLVFFHVVHGFRMPLFFIISGFFTAMLWRQRGLQALLKHRAKRIALPLLIGMVTIIPVLIVSTIVAAAMSESGGGGKTLDAHARLSDAVRLGDEAAVSGHLEAGSDPNEGDATFHVTPLAWAILCGETQCVQLLLDAGASLDSRNSDGATPLHCAAFTGRTELVRLLLKRGADPNAVDHKGTRPVDATLADRGTTDFIGGLLSLNLVWDEVEAGRSKLRPLLKSASDEAAKGEVATHAASEQTGNAPPAGKMHPTLAGYSNWLRSDGIARLVHTPIVHHMWFLWFLCWFVAMFAVFAVVADLIGWKGLPAVLVVSPLRFLWLLPLTLVPQLFMGIDAPTFGPDTSIGLLPHPHLLLYYGLFFAFGSLYYDSDDQDGRLGRWWWLSLPLGLLVAYPIGVDSLDDRLRTSIAQVVYAWAMSFGMMGLFRRVLPTGNTRIRYISDSSYWLYLAHLPLTFLAQAIVRTWPIPSGIKFVLICAGVTGVLLISYEHLVRYTFVGRLLNGPRTRPVRSQVVIHPRTGDGLED